MVLRSASGVGAEVKIGQKFTEQQKLCRDSDADDELLMSSIEAEEEFRRR